MLIKFVIIFCLSFGIICASHDKVSADRCLDFKKQEIENIFGTIFFDGYKVAPSEMLDYDSYEPIKDSLIKSTLTDSMINSIYVAVSSLKYHDIGIREDNIDKVISCISSLNMALYYSGYPSPYSSLNDGINDDFKKVNNLKSRKSQVLLNELLRNFENDYYLHKGYNAIQSDLIKIILQYRYYDINNLDRSTANEIIGYGDSLLAISNTIPLHVRMKYYTALFNAGALKKIDGIYSKNRFNIFENNEALGLVFGYWDLMLKIYKKDQKKIHEDILLYLLEVPSWMKDDNEAIIHFSFIEYYPEDVNMTNLLIKFIKEKHWRIIDFKRQKDVDIERINKLYGLIEALDYKSWNDTVKINFAN